MSKPSNPVNKKKLSSENQAKYKPKCKTHSSLRRDYECFGNKVRITTILCQADDLSLCQAVLAV